MLHWGNEKSTCRRRKAILLRRLQSNSDMNWPLRICNWTPMDYFIWAICCANIPNSKPQCRNFSAIAQMRPRNNRKCLKKLDWLKGLLQKSVSCLTKLFPFLACLLIQAIISICLSYLTIYRQKPVVNYQKTRLIC